MFCFGAVFGGRHRFGLPELMLYFGAAFTATTTTITAQRQQKKEEGKRKKRQRIAKPREGFVFGRVVRVVRQGRTGTMRRIDERMIRSLNNNEVLTILRRPSTNHGLKIMITPAVKDAESDAARSLDEAI